MFYKSCVPKLVGQNFSPHGFQAVSSNSFLRQYFNFVSFRFRISVSLRFVFNFRRGECIHESIDARVESNVAERIEPVGPPREGIAREGIARGGIARGVIASGVITNFTTIFLSKIMKSQYIDFWG